MTRALRLLLVLVALLSGCRTVDDFMVDLETIDPNEGGGVFERESFVFDAGQVLHESLVGLSLAKQMQLWQAMRAIHKACTILGKADKNALLRADAAVLIGRLAGRVPVVATDEPYVYFEGVDKLAVDQVTRLSEASKPLRIAAAIANLESPDEAQRQQAFDGLRDLTGADHGSSVEPWKTWWAGARAEYERQFVKDSEEPARILGQIKFKHAQQARSVLGILAFFLRQTQDPEFQNVLEPSVLRLARQAVVLSLSEAIADPSQDVRCDVADAMRQVADRAFGEPLLRQLQRDRDAHSTIRIVEAVGDYPDRRTVITLLAVLQSHDLRIRTATARTLTALTSADLGTDLDAWTKWWSETGDKRWP